MLRHANLLAIPALLALSAPAARAATAADVAAFIASVTTLVDAGRNAGSVPAGDCFVTVQATTAAGAPQSVTVRVESLYAPEAADRDLSVSVSTSEADVIDQAVASSGDNAFAYVRRGGATIQIAISYEDPSKVIVALNPDLRHSGVCIVNRKETK